MKPQDVIAALYAAGGSIRLDLERPALLVPDRVRPLIEPHRPMLRSSVNLPLAVRTAAIFREQIDLWALSGRAGAPVVRLPDAPETIPGSCISCGATLTHGHWRCPTCTAALYGALRPMDGRAS